ncbi:cellulose synthase complex outer membrane protein BcsC [Pseudomonas quasicaspiana]|uniref:cellulose synthase complex outer membrane protein BcsC n=1 Tax=Pseudomonas quasicaspiana TaxID=2829821 RepID=UPI001E4E54C0|nr:cellulose synthase complex outer membrane protein BcsC [Pseudomonas quasicaspiana]
MQTVNPPPVSGYRLLPKGALKALAMCGALSLSCWYGTALSATVAPAPQDQQQWLLQQARIGEALYRDDLVRDALARLELIDPNHPQVLVGKIRQALADKSAPLNTAWIEQLMARLRQQGPDSAALRQASALIRLNSQEGAGQLQQARLFAAAGRFDQASEAFEQLFGKEPPDLPSALEYWSARSRISGQRAAVIEHLKDLDRDYPGNASVRQMLVGLLFAEGRNDQALAVLHQLAADPQASNNAAEREFIYLNTLPVSPETARSWQVFLDYYPYSSFRKDATQRLAEQQRLLADPAWQAGAQAKRLLERDKGTDSAQAEVLLRRAVKAYPQDSSLYGALGTSLMRQDKYPAALEAFSTALTKEQDTYYISKWQDLQLLTRNWMILQQGDEALQRKDYVKARKAYQQARILNPKAAAPLLGLAAVALGEADDIGAEALLLQARKAEPNNTSVLRALVRLYRGQSSAKAEAFLDSLPASSQSEFAALRQSFEIERLNQQADVLSERSDWAQLVLVLKKIRQLDPDNPWLTYRLAAAEIALGKPVEADDAFRQLLARQGSNPEARYAHGLYLANLNRDSDVLSSLGQIPAKAWTDNMRELAARIKRRQLLAQAQQLRDAGREPQAIALLRANPTLDDFATLADWAMQRGDYPEAESDYRKVLKADPENAEAQLGLIEVQIATARMPQAHAALSSIVVTPAAPVSWQRRLANAWAAVGEKDKANAIFAQLLKTPQTDPLLYRDAARLMAKDHPQQALDNYARSMASAGLISPAQGSPRDNLAMTEASRAKDADDWLPRSLRSEVDELYKQQNPTVNVYRDFAWRTDNTAPGISDLTTQTTILRIDSPFAAGQGFVQAEQVDLQATAFDTDADGLHREAFGTCAVQFRDRTTGALVANGCRSTSQSTSGPSLAVGWKNAQWAVDLGHTPQGFEVGNWLGGVAYSSDWQSIGWTLTASRRPVSNSVVSYAGAVDPVTGTRWGGVTSNGLTLSLSHDEGGVDGVWASFGSHWLRGTNVVDNQRLSAMTGYYYRLMDRADERMRTGLTLMYWGYDKDLSEYTLGQGGYYSPQQYYSIGVPFSYAWRNANWSVQLDSSVGWSFSKTDSSDLYPLDGPAGKFFSQASDAGLDIDGSTTLTKAASSSSGASVRLQASLERRLSDHLVLGSGVALQHSEGYAPSRAMLYLRYTFDVWQGNLPMPIEAVTPYADMR